MTRHGGAAAQTIFVAREEKDSALKAADMIKKARDALALRRRHGSKMRSPPHR